MGGTLLLTAFMTAFYMFRMYFMTFEGQYRGTAHPHNSPPAMVWPLLALAVPSVFSGYLGVPHQIGDWLAGKELPNAWSHFVYYGSAPHYEAANVNMMMAGTACGLTGILLAAAIYYWKSVQINTAIATGMPWLYNFSLNKWYFDEINAVLVDKLMLAFRAAWGLIDMFIVDNVVNGVGAIAVTIGELLKYTENGRAQTYALTIFGCVAVLTLAAYFFHQ
jgi:NAD(P)H-quinone oxidoreductase subunit 5